MSLIRVATKKKVTPRVASLVVPSQYPSAWFSANRGLKPPLNITLLSADIGTARKMFKKAVTDGRVELGIAVTFLYYYAKTIKMTPEEDWKSYDVTICLKDEEMTPLSFFDVTEKQSPCNASEAESTASDDPWMAGYALSQYRVLKITNDTHKAEISERIKAQLTGLTDVQVSYGEPGDLYRGWLSNKVYNKLVAAFDMFFHRFPDHPLSPLRICTTGARHRDCAGLTSYGYLVDTLGMTNTTDVMEWVFLDSIAADIDRIMPDEDELNVAHSYFPYQVDFGLVAKSSYSATINSCFFEWVHLIGSLMGAQRSLNARHITDKQSSDIFANAACVAYVHNFNFEFKKAYTDDGVELEFDDDEGDEQDDEEGGESKERSDAMKSRDPTEWITLIRSMKGNLPKKVRDFVRGAGMAIRDPRPGSISEHLQKKAGLI